MAYIGPAPKAPVEQLEMEVIVFLGRRGPLPNGGRLSRQVGPDYSRKPTNELPVRPPTAPFACGSTACGAWEECLDGGHPIRRSGARAPWPSCADGSGFRSSQDGPRSQARRPVGIAIHGPSLRSSKRVNKRNGITLPRKGGCVQTSRFHGLCLTMCVDLLLCAHSQMRGEVRP